MPFPKMILSNAWLCSIRLKTEKKKKVRAARLVTYHPPLIQRFSLRPLAPLASPLLLHNATRWCLLLQWTNFLWLVQWLGVGGSRSGLAWIWINWRGGDL